MSDLDGELCVYYFFGLCVENTLNPKPFLCAVEDKDDCDLWEEKD